MNKVIFALLHSSFCANCHLVLDLSRAFLCILAVSRFLTSSTLLTFMSVSVKYFAVSFCKLNSER